MPFCRPPGQGRDAEDRKRGLSRGQWGHQVELPCLNFRWMIRSSAYSLALTSKGTTSCEWSPLMVVAVMVTL